MKIPCLTYAVIISVMSVYPVICSARHPSQAIDGRIDQMINTYLNENSLNNPDTRKFPERITAVSVSIFLPYESAPLTGDLRNYYAGVSGYPPLNQPVNENSLFEIGSITKSFVSAIILQLQAENKLALDDTLEKWLPQYKQWNKVTIRQLLNMTSGIPSYTRDPVFSEKLENDIRAEWTDEELVSYAHPDEPIESGQSKFDYSNTNYILAGMIIEKITNDSLANQLHKRILDNSSYGLKNTYYVAGKNWKAIQDSIMPRMVHGYFYDHETKKLLDTTANNLSWGAAAGAMISNTTDIIHWVQALYHGKIFPDKYKDRELKNLKSVVSMKTGRSIATVTPQDPNGFGLGVGSLYKDPGGQFWYYEGSGLGYRAAYIWKSCNNVTVAAALNSKGGEGNPNAPEGDHILELMFKIYDEIITAYPRYNCDD